MLRGGDPFTWEEQPSHRDPFTWEEQPSHRDPFTWEEQPSHRDPFTSKDRFGRGGYPFGRFSLSWWPWWGLGS